MTFHIPSISVIKYLIKLSPIKQYVTSYGSAAICWKKPKGHVASLMCKKIFCLSAQMSPKLFIWGLSHAFKSLFFHVLGIGYLQTFGFGTNEDSLEIQRKCERKGRKFWRAFYAYCLSKAWSSRTTSPTKWKIEKDLSPLEKNLHNFLYQIDFKWLKFFSFFSLEKSFDQFLMMSEITKNFNCFQTIQDIKAVSEFLYLW